MKEANMFRPAIGLLLAAVFGVAAAQGFPSRPLRILVPFPPGGGTDVAARAELDGHTLLLTTDSN